MPGKVTVEESVPIRGGILLGVIGGNAVSFMTVSVGSAGVGGGAVFVVIDPSKGHFSPSTRIVSDQIALP